MRIKKSFVLIVIVMVVLTFMSYHLPIAKADLIFVEGHITSNTTWTSNNTYRVIGDVVIDLGVTLLIE
ncbi:MAG: hypothetical protein QHH24_08275, partial [Candidatus Bathyarchaeota archaeon]|nr:hypothetical protein [Candidatus Bathyarchaeota archaeon]